MNEFFLGRLLFSSRHQEIKESILNLENYLSTRITTTKKCDIVCSLLSSAKTIPLQKAILSQIDYLLQEITSEGVLSQVRTELNKQSMVH